MATNPHFATRCAARLAALVVLSDGINRSLARGGGVLIAVGVVSILGLLIMPVPPGLMDVLIAGNIAVGVTILLVSLYIPDATRIPSFPTILLLTTLYRLALNVSSTRLILSTGYAGEIINAFGQFVVGGNYVVGGVIFLIVTLIQFIVITKGSERVAEVSARFTLDAMAGKQMAIDADLRNGLVSPNEARTRRRALDNECKLYGAMDGAMKFVKGDAIAGIVISLVNIIGGLVIGVFQMGLTAGEAAQTFALLTIGDGLVSQIPALLISVAAGLVVTRVASAVDDSSGQAGKELVTQILAHPAALALVCATLLVLGLAPFGLPRPVFLGLAAVLGMVALPQLSFVRRRLAAATDAGANAAPGADERPQPEAAAEFRACPTPVTLELGGALLEALFPRGDGRAAGVQERLLELRRTLGAEMGVEFPRATVTANAALPSDGYRILIFENPVVRARMAPDDALLPCHEREARRLGLETRACESPWDHAPACLIPRSQFELAAEAGLGPLAAGQAILQHLRATLRRHSAEFLGVQETQWLLSNLEKTHPDLKEAVVPRPLSIAQLTAVLQRLLREEVPIRDLRLIFETLARVAPAQKHPLDLAEAVRQALRRTLWRRCAGDQDLLLYFALDPDLEQLVEAGRSVDLDRAQVTLSPEAKRGFLKALGAALAARPAGATPPVILTRSDLRPFVRAVLELTYPSVAVLSDQEILADAGLKVQWVGEIRLPSVS